jgi:hypothetical protein
MIHSRTCVFLGLVFLSIALTAACAHGPTDYRTNAITATSAPARPISTVATKVSPPTSRSPAVATPTAIPLTEISDIELVSYLGTAQAQALCVHGGYAYVGFGIQLAVVDISDPRRPQRVGYAVLPNRVLDVAVAGSYAYVATRFDGFHVVDVSDPTQPVVIDIYYPSSHVSSVVIDGSYAYVSNGALRVMDLSDPASPVEVGVCRSLDLMSLVGKVAAVVDDYAYIIYHGGSSKIGGLRIVDVSDPAAPAEVGTFVAGNLVRDAAVSGDYAYLLVGQGIPRLAILDVSDPEHPAEVGLDPMAPWLGHSLAVVDGYLYLSCCDNSGSSGYLQVLDVAEPAHPLELGHYGGITSPVAGVVPQGERVYIAASDGLHVVSVADPTAPVGTGRYRPDTLPGVGRNVTVAGNPSSGSGQVYAYVAAGEDGLQVVDVSDPANPKVVSSHDTEGHAWDIALASGCAYLADEYHGLRVIDVADPFNPVEVGFYDIPGLYEFFHGVAVAGSPSTGSGQVYAYVADGGFLGSGLRIVDISDPAQPAEVSFLPMKIQIAEDFLPARAEDVAVANGYVYLAAGTAGLRVVDVSEPAAPVEVGFYDTPGRADNLTVAGHYAYLADGDLRIVDVSDPTAPTLVGFYDVPYPAGTPHVAVQGHHAYVTSQGIRVLDVSDPGVPVDVAAHPFASGNVAVSGDAIYVIGNGLFILRSLRPANLEAGPDATLHTPPPAGNGNCEAYTAAMTLSATTTRLETGEVFTVTVALANQGCGSLGMPQYRLYVQSDEAQPVLDPGRPEPVVHYLGVAPGQSDAAEFVLRAVEPGQTALSASASFEFHVGYPGPAYWGGSRAGPLVVTVKP